MVNKLMKIIKTLIFDIERVVTHFSLWMAEKNGRQFKISPNYQILANTDYINLS